MRRRGQRDAPRTRQAAAGRQSECRCESGRAQQGVWLREHNSAAAGRLDHIANSGIPPRADRRGAARSRRRRGPTFCIEFSGVIPTRFVRRDAPAYGRFLRCSLCVSRDPFGCRGVSCVKLPAAVAFPIDSQLLDRLEQSRRALPPNSVKPLLRSREPQHAEPGSRSDRSRRACDPRERRCRSRDDRAVSGACRVALTAARPCRAALHSKQGRARTTLTAAARPI